MIGCFPFPFCSFSLFQTFSLSSRMMGALSALSAGGLCEISGLRHLSICVSLLLPWPPSSIPLSQGRAIVPLQRERLDVPAGFCSLLSCPPSCFSSPLLSCTLFFCLLLFSHFHTQTHTLSFHTHIHTHTHTHSLTLSLSHSLIHTYSLRLCVSFCLLIFFSCPRFCHSHVPSSSSCPLFREPQQRGAQPCDRGSRCGLLSWGHRGCQECPGCGRARSVALPSDDSGLLKGCCGAGSSSSSSSFLEEEEEERSP